MYLKQWGSISVCKKSVVSEMANKVREMILLSVAALVSLVSVEDKKAAAELYEMDDIVDALYNGWNAHGHRHEETSIFISDTTDCYFYRSNVPHHFYDFNPSTEATYD
jgi:hypothetical protein